MDTEEHPPPESPRKLPAIGPPASLLAFAAAFLYFIESGAVILAMICGMLALPVMLGAALGLALILARGATGDYRGKWSAAGVSLWVLVAIVLTVASVEIVRTTPWMNKL